MSYLLPLPKLTSSPAMTSSASADGSIANMNTNKAWIKSVTAYSPAPTTIPLLHIPFPAAHPKDGTPPDSAWPEFQVRMDNHARDTGSPHRLNKGPGVLHKSQWTGALKGRTVDRMTYPTTGPVYQPFSQQVLPITSLTGQSKLETPSPPSSLVAEMLQEGFSWRAQPTRQFLSTRGR